MNIVFMGTPDFAVPCLDILLQSPHNIVAVFSQPDRPQGRGYKMVTTPVKALAVEHHIPVHQPEKLRDSDALQILTDLAPDLIVVVAYGQLLPKAILDLPPLGCINVHGSLLPALRGAAPIQWSVLNGDATTGITTMYMGEGMDTGDMILKEETPIGLYETAGELFARLAPMGAQLLLETVTQIEAGTAPRSPQEESLATKAPMIRKQMGELDFSKTSAQINKWVCGMSPWPSAYTFLDDLRLVIHKVELVDSSLYLGHHTAGEIIDPKDLIVATGDGAIQLVTVQPQGKKAMDGSAFSNGRRLTKGEKFTSSLNNPA